MRVPLLLLTLGLLRLPGGESIPWFVQDPDQGGAPGVASHGLKHVCQPPAKPVVVAVIDSGVEITHPELADLIWRNPAETGGKAGVDDDGNGYVDDADGWNFLGGPGGEVTFARLELTRELRRLREQERQRPLYLSEHAYREVLQKHYDQEIRMRRFKFLRAYTQHASSAYLLSEIKTVLGQDPTAELLAAWKGSDPALAMLIQLAQQRLAQVEQQRREYEEARNELSSQFNLDFDDRSVIGDDPNRPDQRDYGNPRVNVPATGFHGTHVAGIVAQVVAAAVGRKELPRYLRLMAIRAVPEGDETDKDVANAIRYAVDNGAQVVNMSFGKAFSPDRQQVEAAIRYAESKGVLLIHAAGNEAHNNDEGYNFPTAMVLAGPPYANYLEVGASGPETGRPLVADFSNYGQNTVDLFAPGVDIDSTAPRGTRDKADGTSMAAPMVSGVAALVLSQFPALDAARLATVLRESVRRWPDKKVVRPGSQGRAVALDTLCRSGGVVNAQRAFAHLKPPAPALVPPEASGPINPP